MNREYCPYCMTPVGEDGVCPNCGLPSGTYTPLPHHIPPGTVLMGSNLVRRVIGEGGLDNPPTLIFAQKPGPAAEMSLAHLGGARFRLVYAPGEVLDKADLRRCDLPYLFFRPQSGVRACV